MELEGDNPAPRSPAPPEPAAAQSLRVTPENVVAMAKMFQGCADRLEEHQPHLDAEMRLEEPWLDDPVSKWAWLRFNEYFVGNEHSFVHIVQSEYEQYQAIRDTLVATAKLYGLHEELNEAGFVDVEADR
jgi:hypothetical protein